MATPLYYNPEYDVIRPKWEMYRDMYEGDQVTLKKPHYLWYHELEKTQHGKLIRQIREQRSAYTNHIETLISQWTSLIFRKDPIVPADVSELLGEALQDIDGSGTSFESFIRNKLVRNSLLYGRPILYVGSYGTKPENLAQERSRSDYKPYWEVIHPLSFVDYQQEKANPSRLNELNFARTEFLEAKPRSSAQDIPYILTVSKEYVVTPEGLLIRRYRLAGEKEQAVFDQETQKQKQEMTQFMDKRAWELESEVLLSDWDEVPIACELDGESWIKDIAPHALKYYNTESVLDNIILFQAYQRIYFASDDMDKQSVQSASEYTNAIVPRDTQIHTVEPLNATTVQTRLDNILNAIYRIGLNQVRMMSADSRAVQSDKTIKEERESVAALVKSEMETVENIVNHGVRLYAKYLGIDSPFERVTFDTDISTDDIDSFIRLTLAFKDDIQKLPQLKKASIKKYIQDANFPEQEELLQEVDNLIQAEQTPKVDPISLLRREINELPEDQG
jgi:hypothetical protein